jgi:hypothetical protein
MRAQPCSPPPPRPRRHSRRFVERGHGTARHRRVGGPSGPSGGVQAEAEGAKPHRPPLCGSAPLCRRLPRACVSRRACATGSALSHPPCPLPSVARLTPHNPRNGVALPWDPVRRDLPCEPRYGDRAMVQLCRRSISLRGTGASRSPYGGARACGLYRQLCPSRSCRLAGWNKECSAT